MHIIQAPLEGPLQENPLPVPDDAPGVADGISATVPETGPADAPHTAALINGSSTPDATSIDISESQPLSPAAETALQAISEIVADGQINFDDVTAIETLLSLDLSAADRIVLIERFDAAVADGTIPTHFEVPDNFWEQQDLNNCAVVAQKMLLDAAGIPNSEGALTLRAVLDGSLPSLHSGMHPSRVGEILERHGISMHTRPHLTLSEIEELLRAGHGVIVGVDADELWFGDDDTVDLGLGDNHVVVLLDIDRTDPDNPVAVMNDSGIPDGAERRVPLQTFLDAFADSGNLAFVTDSTIEELRLVNPDVQTALDALIAITEDGQINLEDESDLANFQTLLSLDLSTADRIVLIERFDAAVLNGTIPFDCEIADNFGEQLDLSLPFIDAQTALLDTLGIPHSKAHLTLRALLDQSLWNSDPLQVGEILERFGISISTLPYATVDELRELLAEGRGVMLIVDGDELEWIEDDDRSDWGIDANHAVLLLDIDLTDPDNPVGLINDGGDLRSVPLQTLMDAFADSGNLAIVTDQPLEELVHRPWIELYANAVA